MSANDGNLLDWSPVIVNDFLTVYFCPVCRSMTDNPARHREWHENLPVNLAAWTLNALQNMEQP